MQWIWYWVDGRRYDESTRQGDERVARSILAQRRREIREGTWRPPGERHARTVADYVELWLERRRKAGVRNVRGEETWLRTWLLPRLGSRPIAEVTRADVRDLVAAMQSEPSPTTGQPYAPRTVHVVYATIRTLFADAAADGLIVSTPCTLSARRGELPMRRDADPRWRANARYTRDEAEILISDPRIPEDRRVYYALQLLAGLRAGEASSRRWGDIDHEARPLQRMLVHDQAQRGQLRETKTGAVREVPVHPVLANVLAQWRLHGFATMFGRPPRPGDFIVPSRRGIDIPRSDSMLGCLKGDLRRLGLRDTGRGRHAMRATFLSLLEVDGANMGIAARATHRSPNAPAGAVSGYLRPTWEDLCREIAKLRIELRGNLVALPLVASAGGDRDSSRDSSPETASKPQRFRGMQGPGRLVS